MPKTPIEEAIGNSGGSSSVFSAEGDKPMSNAIGWIKELWGAGTREPVTWECRPLVICDGDGMVVLMAPIATGEFIPEGNSERRGVARVLSEEFASEVLPLEVSSVTTRDSRSFLGMGHGRDGVQLVGESAGELFTWNLDGFGDDVILEEASPVEAEFSPEMEPE